MSRRKHSKSRKAHHATIPLRARWVGITSAVFVRIAAHGSSAARPIKDKASPPLVWMIPAYLNRSSKFGLPTRSRGITWIRRCLSSRNTLLKNERILREQAWAGTGRRVSSRETCRQFAVSLRHWSAHARQQKNSRRDARYNGQHRQLRHRSTVSCGFRKCAARFGGRRCDVAGHYRCHGFPHKHEERFSYLQPSLRRAFCWARQTKSDAHND